MRVSGGIPGWETVALGGGAADGWLSSAAFVVPNDASAAVIDAANRIKTVLGARVQVCDGIADEVELQAAYDALPTSDGNNIGMLILLEGTFNLSASFVVNKANTAIFFMVGSKLKWALSNGATPAEAVCLSIQESNISIWEPWCEGPGSAGSGDPQTLPSGNGIGILVGGNTPDHAPAGYKTVHGVHIYSPKLHKWKHCVDFGIDTAGTTSSGDNYVYGCLLYTSPSPRD